MRLVAVGLAVASLAVACGQRSIAPPTATLVVQAMHFEWPDGSDVESGGLHYPFDLYAVDVDGTHVRDLTHDDATTYLVGRLSNGRIAYESESSDRMKRSPSRIYSLRADGGGRRELASGAGELLPQISPDGGRILFGHGGWLYVVRSDGTQQRQLTRTSFGHYAPYVGSYDASWSADGKRIAFVRGYAKRSVYGGELNPRSDIYVMDANGGGVRRLTKLGPKVVAMYPSWSPDGRRIAFVQHDFTGGEIHDYVYVMHADGTDLKRVPRLEGDGWFWLDDDRIAYGGKSIDVDGGKPRPAPDRARIGGVVWITSGRAAGYWPVSPDGNWFAFIAGRGLWIERLDGTHRRLVTRKICCFFSNIGVAWAGT